MSFATLTSRYRHWKNPAVAPYETWNGIHSFRLVGRLWLTFRPRQLRYTSLGPWVYAINNVVDFGFHFVIVSIGLKYQRARREA